jgi:WD40 repeat protein
MERRRLIGHDAYVVGGCWSPNGRRVLTWEWGEAAILWDADSGRLLARLFHDGVVRFAAFAPDGRAAATLCDDNRIRVWDAADGRLLANIDARVRIQGLAFIPGETVLLATGGADGSVRLWSYTGRQGEERALRESGPKIAGLACTPDGRLGAIDAEGTIRIWDAPAGTLLVEAPAKAKLDEGNEGERPPTALAFLDRGRVVATSGAGTVRFHAVEKGALRLLAEGKSNGPPAVSGFGNRVATWHWTPKAGEPDGRAPVMEIRESDALDAPRESPLERAPFRMALDWNGDRLALLCQNEIELRDARDGSRYATLRGHKYDMKDAAFSVDSTRLLTCSADMTARIWDSEPPDTVRVPPGVPGWSLSPDGRRRLVLDEEPAADGSVGVSIREQSVFASDTTFTLPRPLDSLRWLPDGANLLAVAGGKVLLLDASGNRVGEVPLPAGMVVKSGTQCDFSGDRKRVAFRLDPDAVVVADFATQKVLPMKLAVTPLHFAMSPDGKCLLGANGSKGTATVVEIDTGRVVHTLSGHTGYVLRVAWSPDGKLLATSAMEGRVRVWDAESGLQVSAVAPVPMKTNPVVFGDGHRWLLVETDEVMLCEAETGKRVFGIRPPAPPGTKFAFRWLEGTGTLALQWGDPARVRLCPLDPLAVAKLRIPVEMEPLAVKTHGLLEGAEFDAYDEAWLRRHPTARSFARRGAEAARKGRLEDAFRWVDAARILRPRLSDVDWADACVRAKKAEGLPAGAERDGEIAKALEALARAVAADENLKVHARSEVLLTVLRQDLRYQALVGGD